LQVNDDCQWVESAAYFFPEDRFSAVADFFAGFERLVVFFFDFEPVLDFWPKMRSQPSENCSVEPVWTVYPVMPPSLPKSAVELELNTASSGCNRQAINLRECHPAQIHSLSKPKENRTVFADLILTNVPIISVVGNY
jgi:hypothetical protein